MQDLISVMIVDDERLALEYMCTIVDWEKHGFKIVATAFNGAQAFTKFLQFHPQIVITDIKMPIMGGIELIKKIREIDQHVLLLLLTAYADFEYARTAIHQRITDYIIKGEITAQSMKELLNRLHVSVDKQRKNHNILIDTMLENFFSFSSELINAEERSILHRQFAFLIIEQNSPVTFVGLDEPHIEYISQANIKRFLRKQKYIDIGFVGVCSLSDQRTLLILNPRDKSILHTFDCIRRNAVYLQELLAEYEDISFTLYIAIRPMDFYDLRHFLQNNYKIFKKKYFTSNNTFIPIEEIPRSSTVRPTFNTKIFEELIKEGDEKQITQYLKTLYNAISSFEDYNTLATISSEIYQTIIRQIELFPELFLYSDICIEPKQSHRLNAISICKWLTDKSVELFRIFNREYKKIYSHTILEAITYINVHFSNSNLSLNEIADSLHISVGYMCVLFKQETGMTIKNYINDVRIREAKRMLSDGYAKIYEISEACGYQTSQYFSRVFQKKIGVLPGEYRKNRRK